MPYKRPPRQSQVPSQTICWRLSVILYREIESEQDHIQLHEDLNTLEGWESMWGMPFNPTKCYIMRIVMGRRLRNCIYPLCGHPLEQVETNPYLGVITRGRSSTKTSSGHHTYPMYAKRPTASWISIGGIWRDAPHHWKRLPTSPWSEQWWSTAAPSGTLIWKRTFKPLKLCSGALLGSWLVQHGL